MQDNLLSRFSEILAQLNPEQKQAVEQTEGPVLVVAGPGTGKTQILAARIGYILLETDTAPNNILCLTYTDAGVIAMRQRLTQFIGAEAYRVHIHTFHSFCNAVIQENIDYFGLRALEPVSEIEKIEIIHEIIDGFDKNNPLKRYSGDTYYETGKLDRLYKLMKQEAWTLDSLKAAADDFIQDLPFRDEYIYKKNGKGYNKGDVKQKQIDEQISKMDKLLAAAATFDVYNEKLKQRGRYDFADMILWVLRAFEENENMLRTYQERYIYYLVDEFQDTSGVQGKMLYQMTDYWDSPNVFVVGDDDQSIYAFQNANIKNIIDFANKHKDLQTVMMTSNYRSTQSVLDLASTVIAHNKERLVNEIKGLSKDLKALNPKYHDLAIMPEILLFPNPTHECAWIASKIESLIEQGTEAGEIAVIYRKHSQAEDLTRYLQSRKIPLNIKKRVDILQEPLTLKIINVLEYVLAETTTPFSGEHLLFQMLHYDIFDLKPLDIALLYRKVYQKKEGSLREEISLQQHPKPDLFHQNQTKNPIKSASEIIERWIESYTNLTLQQWLEMVINEGGFLAKVMGATDNVWQMEVLHTFFDFVKDESAKNTHLQLKQLLERIKLHYDFHIQLAVNKVVYAEDGVNFVTAHSSKGLEFAHVFLLGCTKDNWEKGNTGGDYAIPDTVVKELNPDDEEESRRLFYVAITRAKTNLFLCYHTAKANGKEVECSRFLVECQSLAGMKDTFFALNDEAVVSFEEAVKTADGKDLNHWFNADFTKQLLKNYTLSITHLNAYLKCPLRFYFENVLRVPRAKAGSMTFGSAIHYALEKYFLMMLENEQQEFPETERALYHFKWYMKRNEDTFTPKDYLLKLEYGLNILPRYIETHIQNWSKIVAIEKAFRNLHIHGVPVNGKVDRIDFNGQNAFVTDYKTGNYKNAIAKFKAPVQSNDTINLSHEAEYGGDYWRQAVFYKLLLDADKSKNWHFAGVRFDFIEPDRESGKYFQKEILITPEDEETVTRQIEQVYRQIMDLNFTGCGKADCEWCHFVENNFQLKDGSSFAVQEED